MGVGYFTVKKVYFAFILYLLWSCQIKSIFSGGPIEVRWKNAQYERLEQYIVDFEGTPDPSYAVRSLYAHNHN